MGFMGIVSACRYDACFFWKTDPLFRGNGWIMTGYFGM